MQGELLDELLEACPALRPRRFRMRLGHRRHHGQVVADEKRQGLDQDRLVALQPFELPGQPVQRSEEHTSELQSLMRISYAVFCLKKKQKITEHTYNLLLLIYIYLDLHTIILT